MISNDRKRKRLKTTSESVSEIAPMSHRNKMQIRSNRSNHEANKTMIIISNTLLFSLVALGTRAAQVTLETGNNQPTTSRLFSNEPFQLYPNSFANNPRPETGVYSRDSVSSLGLGTKPAATIESSTPSPSLSRASMTCPNGLLTFELSTGYIYKPSSIETLAMMPSTLQLTDCLDSCLQNSSCLAINFEMGLCVLLSSSAQQNPTNLYSSQFPVFTIYAEKKCLLSSVSNNSLAAANKTKRKCQRAWTFERVAGYEMRTKPKRRIKLASRELCMETCLQASDFECRSANWYRETGECTLSDQDRHSISQAEAGDQRIKSSLKELYGPSNLTSTISKTATSSSSSSSSSSGVNHITKPALPPGLYQNYYTSGSADHHHRTRSKVKSARGGQLSGLDPLDKRHRLRLSSNGFLSNNSLDASDNMETDPDWRLAQMNIDNLELQPANNALVDYLENNCVYEPNKLCEFRKIQNRILKTVDSIYQDVTSLEECKQKCLNAPYRCYSFDYGDTSERVCRTSHLDQASLMAVKEPYLEVVGAITYELASCFNVSIQCRAHEMVAQVSSSKMFKGKIYVKSRPNSCQTDVKESLSFELSMRYHDDQCDVRSSSNKEQGIFSNDIIIQHHDRIVTTQDVGLSVYCQYDLGNKSITNNVDLAIERIEEPTPFDNNTSGKTPQSSSSSSSSSNGSGEISHQQSHKPDGSSSLTITSLATTVVRSPNVTMRITNMNGQPVSSATVGDRLALLFEIKEKTSPFGIFVREIIAMDGKQMTGKPSQLVGYNGNESTIESMYQANKANSVLFIDSEGCPTDANIMGPLVKMDPAGQRILAPFDAFKFPSSDMVFFRAVVSSCVSECKPVVCPAQQTQANDFDLSIGSSSSSSSSALFSTGSDDASRLVASTRNMQPATHSTNRLAYSASTSAMTSNDPKTTASLVSSTVAPETTTIARVQTKSPPGDTLTTIAGFNGDSTAGTGADMTTWFDLLESSNNNNNQSNVNYAANITNNNHQGKTPPRPPQLQNLSSNADYQGDNRLDLPAPVDLASLSSQQKQQLIKMFESKLRQSTTNLTEMADLYTGFLTSVMLSNNNGIVLGPIDDDKSSGNGRQFAAAAAAATNQLNREDQSDRVAMIVGQASETDILDGFISYLAALFKRQQSSTTEANQNSLAKIVGLLDKHSIGAGLNKATNNQRSSTTQSPGRLGDYIDPTIVQVNSTEYQPQQHFERTPLESRLILPADPMSGANRVELPSMEATTSYQHNNNDKQRQLPQQSSTTSNNLDGNNSAAPETDMGGSMSKQRQGDNLHQTEDRLYNKLPVNSFTSYGRRKRRAIGDYREKEKEKEGDEANYYVELSQPQDSFYINPASKDTKPFRQAFVKMYHTNALNQANDLSNKMRHKRDAVTEQQQQHLPDELVVQSIKIVDRLQFLDEQETRPLEATSGSHSTDKRSRVLRKESRGWNLHEKTGDDESPMQEAADRSARWSALSLIIVGLLFIFAQTFLVLICLLDWTTTTTTSTTSATPITKPSEQFGAPSLFDGSTISGSSVTTSCDPPATLAHYLSWPEDSARCHMVTSSSQAYENDFSPPRTMNHRHRYGDR